MTYRFIYDTEYSRTIFACMMDARKGTSLANQIGSVQKAYIDAEVAKVTSTVIPYKIETNNGNLAGFFTLQTAGTVGLYRKVLRPAFQPFDAEISEIINTFITENAWKGDILL